MRRAIILLCDSLGVGASEDAGKYGDMGSNTLGHILDYCSSSPITAQRKQIGSLNIPHLTRLGLLAAEALSRKQPIPKPHPSKSLYGYGVEISHGKDTPSGHWEICGVPVLFDWGYFPKTCPSFPSSLINQFIAATQLPGVLGNCHASGTQIIEDLAELHIATGKPIIYTSADSVFQIAAHEERFGLERLYKACEIARELTRSLNIGRVIARPFSGNAGHFYRTGNRRDYALPPPETTLLEKLVDAGGHVVAIGKTADIFAHKGITQEIKANGNMAIFDATLEAIQEASKESIIFANFVDFDSSYGHRRDVDGYAAALEAFDRRLPELDRLLGFEDLVIITADHGCDPTWQGSDHTREHIPILAYGPFIAEGRSIGQRNTFADIGQSLASFFKLSPFKQGTSFLG